MKHNAIYLTSVCADTDKNEVALGLLNMLKQQMGKIAIFRPVLKSIDPDAPDPTINLLLKNFKLDMEYRQTFAYTEHDAKELINRGKRNMLLENIIQAYKRLLDNYDFVLCIGTDLSLKDSIFEFELNAQIAANIGAPLALVLNGDDAAPTDLAETLNITCQSLQNYSLTLLTAIILNSRLTETELDDLRANFANIHKGLVYALPQDSVLAYPTMVDAQKNLKAKVLYGANYLENAIKEYLVADMEVSNFIRNIKAEQLVITSGDRSDIILSVFASHLSTLRVNPAGILLTGAIEPSDEVKKVLENFAAVQIPIIMVKQNSLTAVNELEKLKGVIEPQDSEKITRAIDLFEKNVNQKELVNRLLEERAEAKMTPLMFEYELVERAKRKKMRIVLCEGEDERILRATDILLRREVADIILLGNSEAIRTKAHSLNLEISNAKIINPVLSPEFPNYVKSYYEFRKAKGITEEQARNIMSDSTYYGTMMVKLDDADGMVSGAVNTTAHTIRPAFEFIKTKPGFSVVSSVFLMCLKDRVLVFGDCAVNPNPTAQQLAEIAIASARTATVFGITPRVAMLSYSTGTSGKGIDVDLVKEATKIAKELAPDLNLDGPLQYDAAIDPIVAQTKLPASTVAGKATVFIFPDLNTGNNTYKAVQRAANAIAIGPVLQGLNKPVNDLSRGCLVPDIVNTVAITAIQAAADKK